MHYYYPMMQGFDGLGIMMMVFWLVVLGVVILVAVRLLRHNDGVSSNRPDPIDIIKERYAKGEITKAQFEELKRDLLKQ